MYPDAGSPDSSLRSRANRVSRACDRCRIRKIKCNGKSQCNKCSVDDAICVYTKKRRPNDRAYSKEYVQLLEEQRSALVRGVKELYRRHSVGEGLPTLANGCGENMLIHEVLHSLDVLPKQADPADFECEDDAQECSQSSSTLHCASPQQRQSSMSSTPGLSMSPSLSANSIASTPILPQGQEFEGLMNSLDEEELQAIQYLSEPAYLNTKPEGGFFDEAYVMGGGIQPFIHSLPGDSFVNPRDMMFQLGHAYTT